MTTNDPSLIPSPTDAEILSTVLAGDHKAYGEIVRRYQKDVWGIIASSLSGIHRCEDLVQDAFVKAFFALDTFDLRRPFGPWIRTIARNEVLMELRRVSREKNRLEQYRQQLLCDLADSDIDELEEERKQRLRDCIGRLHESTAAAVRLRYEQGLGFEEIGQQLERSAEATRVMIGRARVSLKKCLESP